MVNEISVSQDYYSNQYSKALPNKIFVTGSLPSQPELLELINSKIQYEFVQFPLNKTGLFKSNNADQKKLAYSCLPTLAAAATRYRLCNLLPKEIRHAQSCRTVGRYGRLALALVTVILLTSWAYLRMSIDSSYSSIEVIEQQVARASQSEAYNKHRSLIQQIAFNRAYIKMTETPSGIFHYSLKELSILTPSEIKLYRLEYTPELLEDRQNLVLHGNVEGIDIPPEMILVQYVERLKKSGLYHNVELVRHVKRKVMDTFLIDFQIEMQGVT